MPSSTAKLAEAEARIGAARDAALAQIAERRGRGGPGRGRAPGRARGQRGRGQGSARPCAGGGRLMLELVLLVCLIILVVAGLEAGQEDRAGRPRRSGGEDPRRARRGAAPARGGQGAARQVPAPAARGREAGGRHRRPGRGASGSGFEERMRADFDAAVKRRTEHAMERIAQEEQQAAAGGPRPRRRPRHPHHPPPARPRSSARARPRP